MITVKIHDIARGGSGVGRLENGEVVFVPFTAPGDLVEINILKKTKNYSHAELVNIVEKSPLRVNAPCAVFGKCGGCTWQHLPYSLQFETKKKGVLQALKRAGVSIENTPIDELPAKNQYHYRNRIQLRGNPAQNTLGFMARESNELVPIHECEITDSKINEMLPEVKTLAQKQTQPYKVEIELDETGAVRIAWNEQHGAHGFRQVNDQQNIQLQNWIKDQIGTGELLLDLYGGAGNLSHGLKSQFQRIECVDTSAPVKKSTAQVQFHALSTVAWLKKATSFKGSNTSVILDPPRSGMAGEFALIESLISEKFSPNTLILVGCDPDSFSRDTFGFVNRGYQLKRLAVLDLFPQTPHVESLAVFKK